MQIPSPPTALKPMFTLLLFGLVLAALIHARQRPTRDRHELILVYVLAGYCGFAMVVVSIWGMIEPPFAAGLVGAEPGNPFQEFFLVAYLGMSVMATLSIWVRGTFLLANVICWSIYWAGATGIHLVDYAEAGELSFKMAMTILGAHALAPLILVVSVIGWYRGRAEGAA